MAKKRSKRPNLSQETLERARAELRGERPDQAEVESVGAVTSTGVSNGASAGAVAAASAAKPKIKRGGGTLATRHIPTTDELVKEYAYVLKDLRNLAILAGILLLIIIGAAILLPRPTG
jgi:hypothetical protein